MLLEDDAGGGLGRANHAWNAGPAQVLEVYARCGWFAIGIGVVVLLLARPVTKLMHLDTLGKDVDHAMAGDTVLAEPAAAGIDTRGEQSPRR